MIALVRYGIGLGLFQDVDTIEDGRHRALALVSTIVSSFMLLEIDGKIKMHVVVRDFAIHVACREKAEHIMKAGVISSLHKLEELYIGTAFTRWAVEGEDNSRNNVSLSELKSLSQLTGLCLSVPNADMIPDDLRFEKLIRDLDRDGFDQLKSLELHFCHEMKYLLDKIDGAPRVPAPFCNLEELTLCCLANFSEICRGQLPNESFSNLRSVNLSFCAQLRLLFPPSLVQRLVYLRRLELHYCSNLEEILAMDGKEQIGKSLSTSTNLQNLTDVTFCECDRLRNIFSLTIARGLVQLKQLYIRRCAMVETVVEDEKGEETVLSIDKIVFPHLYDIHLEKLDSLVSSQVVMLSNVHYWKNC
ncbi:hypothetical protein TEA_002395 [Camellia sinensis var. sinensis]|uniref:Disease resistance protein At4g27190-like leucine-rich repeats domain-containing protein n=1 Tax=Camellia sinensis var. sinensis TaxID=542762 RepID=A0A4S4D335_CAMSN|nr:hypothetical protein TEA_002395 [Camellia sinensis var. sinensis]